MRTNYVLIDYESVQPDAFSTLDPAHFKVLVFLGSHQSKISVDTAAALQPMGSSADYIRIVGNGPNALDFHIAFYIGQYSAVDPTGYFHIISKDKGSDPLIQHLKAKKLLAARYPSIDDIPLLRVTKAVSSDERIAIIIANLQQRGAAKPRTIKTLSSTISAIFLKALPEEELSMVLRELQAKGYVTTNGTRIAYSLPACEP